MANANDKPEESHKVKAIVTVQQTTSGLLSSVVTAGLDGFTDLAGKSLLVELISVQLDPSKYFFFM